MRGCPIRSTTSITLSSRFPRGGACNESDFSVCRCVWGAAAGLEADARANTVPLSFRIHRQAGRDRKRGRGTGADVFSLLWCGLLEPASNEICRRTEKKRWSGTTLGLIWSIPGWNGNAQRISISDTRRIIDAILDGSIETAGFDTLPYFNLSIPRSLNGKQRDILDPRNSYADKGEWDRKAKKLAGLFIENFRQYEDIEEGRKLAAAGPTMG